MPNRVTTKRPLWLLIAGIILLIWNLIGLAAFVSQAVMTANGALASKQQELFSQMPAWDWTAYALAVFTGGLGAGAVLLRKRWAVGLFAVSVVAVVAQLSYPFFIAKTIDITNLAMSGFPLFIFLVGCVQTGLAWRWRADGWLA